MAELYERKKDYNLVQNQENIFQENKEFLLSLKESEWRQKTLEERTIAAQKMVRLETERLGIPEIPLYVKETGSSNCVALYNNEENEIWYAPEHLTSQTAEEFFTGICEECYHGMEYYLLERMDWNSEMANTAYFEEMRKWKLMIIATYLDATRAIRLKHINHSRWKHLPKSMPVPKQRH